MGIIEFNRDFLIYENDLQSWVNGGYSDISVKVCNLSKNYRIQQVTQMMSMTKTFEDSRILQPKDFVRLVCQEAGVEKYFIFYPTLVC